MAEAAVPVLRLEFPAGRYHARPWGSHPVEQRLEWPPSPWRLTRALVDIAHRHGRADLLRPLVDALASASWRFTVPPALEQTIVSYQLPTQGRLARGQVGSRVVQLEAGKRPGHTDQSARRELRETAAVLGVDRTVWVHLPAMEDSTRVALATLVHGLTRVGRAETWVLAGIDDGGPAPNCAPATGARDEEAVRTLLCLDPALTVEDLGARVVDARRHGVWPRGARPVAYALPEVPPPPAVDDPPAGRVTAVRLRLLGRGVAARGLVPLTDAVWGRLSSGGSSPRPCIAVLPDRARPGRLREVVVWWRGEAGSAAAAEGLVGCGRLSVRGLAEPVGVAALGVDLDGRPGGALDPLLSQPPTRVWESVTPLRTAREFDVSGWAAALPTGPPESLERISERQRAYARAGHWSHMAPMERGSERQRPEASGWRLRFARPVAGPVVLGHARDTARGFGVFVGVAE